MFLQTSVSTYKSTRRHSPEQQHRHSIHLFFAAAELKVVVLTIKCFRRVFHITNGPDSVHNSCLFITICTRPQTSTLDGPSALQHVKGVLLL
jgi:hypothetical protein